MSCIGYDGSMSALREKKHRDRDLDSPAEIDVLMEWFYGDVAQDELLGHIFNDVAHVQWDSHIPHIGQFWKRMMFGEAGYVGNPLEAHQNIHDIEPFTHAHFQRWLELFQENVDLGWTGPYAQEIKRKAVKIALVHSRFLTGTPLDVLLHVGSKNSNN